MTTLATMRTAVRTNLDEASASFWSNTQIDGFINQGKDRVWTEVRKLKEDYFLVQRTSLDGSVSILGSSYDTSNFRITSSGTLTYSLPPDLVEVKLIECITSSYEYVRFDHC